MTIVQADERQLRHHVYVRLPCAAAGLEKVTVQRNSTHTAFEMGLVQATRQRTLQSVHPTPPTISTTLRHFPSARIPAFYPSTTTLLRILLLQLPPPTTSTIHPKLTV